MINQIEKEWAIEIIWKIARLQNLSVIAAKETCITLIKDQIAKTQEMNLNAFCQWSTCKYYCSYPEDFSVSLMTDPVHVAYLIDGYMQSPQCGTLAARFQAAKNELLQHQYRALLVMQESAQRRATNASG